MQKSRIDNFICPACGEVIKQVVAVNGVVKGWCQAAKKEIKVVITPSEETTATNANTDNNGSQAPLTEMESLKIRRGKVLKDLISAREDGDLKENSAYHAAREQLTIIDYKITVEEERLKRLIANN